MLLLLLLLQIVDMLAAATYLAGALEPWVALIVFVTIGSYIPLTIIVTEWRGNFRRDMNKTGASAGGCCIYVCMLDICRLSQFS